MHLGIRDILEVCLPSFSSKEYVILSPRKLATLVDTLAKIFAILDKAAHSFGSHKTDPFVPVDSNYKFLLSVVNY
jgi:hypothetical protein